MYLSVATLAQASQMAHTSGSVDQHADLVPGEDPRLCDLHLSSRERSYLMVFPHIRQFLMMDFQAQKREVQMKKRELQMIAFRNRYFMRRMFNRPGQATDVLPPDLVSSSDDNDLAHRYPNEEDSDSDSDSDINLEPQSDVELIIRTGEGLHAGDAGENKEEDDDIKASKGGA